MYREIIARVLSELIFSVDYDNRLGKIHDVESLIKNIKGRAKQHHAENFVFLTGIEHVIFGQYGECGMAVFYNSKLQEVVRIAFVNTSEKINAWILDE